MCQRESLLRKDTIDFGIITALPLERDAVLNFLHLERITDAENNVFFKGKILHKPTNEYFNIVLIHGDIGNVESVLATNKLISKWNPKYLALIGIAGGISKNKVSIGDIIVPKEIVYFTITKKESSKTQIHPSHHLTDPILFDNHLKNFPSMKDDFKWKEKIKEIENIEKLLEIFNLNSASELNPQIHYGSIFSGDTVVKDENFVKKLLTFSPKGLGIEMESWGALMASFKDLSQPRFITIRGVSDLADNPDSKKWDKVHYYAASIATLYFRHFLEYGSLEPIIKSELLVKGKIKPIFSKIKEDHYLIIQDDILISNLIKIAKIDYFWAAETPFKDYSEINNAIVYTPPYTLFENKLISFFPFTENNRLQNIIDINTITPVVIREWSQDLDLRRIVIRIFNQTINELCRTRGLFYSKETNRWYFPNFNKKKILKKSWKKKRESDRTVCKFYEKLNSYFHHSVSINTLYHNEDYYYCLLPQKTFTINGIDLTDSESSKKLEERFRSTLMNYNQGLLNLTDFWYHYLFEHKEIFSDPIYHNPSLKEKRKLTREILQRLRLTAFENFTINVTPFEKPSPFRKKRISDDKSTVLM